MLADLFKYIVQNIRHRVMRSSLTILSILIGIMAIYALVSFGQGVSKYVSDIATQSGADKVIAMPAGAGVPGTTGTYLTDEDLSLIRKTNGVAEATAMIMRSAEVKRKEGERGKYTYAMGLSTAQNEQALITDSFTGIGIEKGRALKKGDGRKIVVGHSYLVANKIFPKALKVGDTLLVNNVQFEIIGFYAEIGSAQDDAQIYMTNEQIKDLYAIGDQYGMIFIRAEKTIPPSELATRLTEKLRKEKGQKEGQEDFTVQSYEQLLETFGTVITVLNAILVIIAGISVLVAAVNITNTMYTAVLERTKEIGIMKAVGARNSHILTIFFFEAGALGFIGGALGILTGYGLAKIGQVVLANIGYGALKPFFPWWLTVGCLLFAFAIGAGSGFLPALQASRQRPVDALRYE
jgi:putative ABC transport system permease protein